MQPSRTIMGARKRIALIARYEAVVDGGVG
jgi:hypothetical protein